METLPILLDHLVSPIVAIVMSVTLVLIAGEIIPQALCTNRPLLLGSFFAPFIRCLMWLTAPVSYPMARLLDYILRDSAHGGNARMRKSELDALVELHGEGKGGDLPSASVKMIRGALAFSERPVYDIMTPLSRCFTVEIHRVLNFTLLTEIFRTGYSRIPVWDSRLPATDNIVGLLLVKDLLLLDPDDEYTVEALLQYYPHPLERVFHDSHLRELLEVMRSGAAHMALVYHINNAGAGDPFRVNLGIVTLEDVIESILQMEIKDESDVLSSSNESNRQSMADRYARRRNLPQHLAPNEEVTVLRYCRESVDTLSNPRTSISDAGLRTLIRQSVAKDVKVKLSLLKRSASYTDRAAGAGAAPLTPASASPLTASLVPPHELFNVDIAQGGWSLYRRGEASEYVTLLMDGTAQITAGAEGFVMQVAAWSVLGALALKGIHKHMQPSASAIRRKGEMEGEAEAAAAAAGEELMPVFIPDFSAVLTSPSRVLRISRTAYLMMLRQEAGLQVTEIAAVAAERVRWGAGVKETAQGKPTAGSLPPRHPTAEQAGGRTAGKEAEESLLQRDAAEHHRGDDRRGHALRIQVHKHGQQEDDSKEQRDAAEVELGDRPLPSAAGGVRGSPPASATGAAAQVALGRGRVSHCLPAAAVRGELCAQGQCCCMA